MVLVDDYYTRADGVPALASETADIPNAAGGGNVDLARMTLGQVPTGMVDGKYQILLSDPTAVRLFQADGTLLYEYGRTGDGVLTLDLANPTGYLAGLLSGDLDVWLEGVHAATDFNFAIFHEDAGGRITAHDDTYISIVDWTFQNNLRQIVDSVQPIWGQDLLDAAQPGVSFTYGPIGMDRSENLYKNVITGLPEHLFHQMLVTSGDQSASYTDVLDDYRGGIAVSRAYQALYSTQDDYGVNPTSPLTPDQQAALLSLGINVLPGPLASSTLLVGHDDKTTRLIKIAGAVPFTLNSEDGVYHEGDTITATFTRPTPLNTRSPYWYSITVTVTNGKTDSRYFAAFDTSDQVVVSFPAVSMLAGVTITKVPKYFTLSAQIVVHTPSPNGVILSFLDARSVTLAVLPPNQKAFSTYQQGAWDALKNQNAGNYVTGDVRQRNVQITTLYATMFNSNQSAFEWSGVAAFASYSGGVAMKEAEEWLPFGWQAVTGLYNWKPDWILPPAPDADELLKFFGEGNITIFMDMYPQMMAYQAGLLADLQHPKPLQFLSPTIPAGGLPTNVQLVTQSQYDAWQKITDGVAQNNAALVLEGNTDLVTVEQTQTLQAVLLLDPPIWDQVIKWNPIKSPIPGDDSTFREFAKGASFFNAQLRVDWFKQKMVDAWEAWRLDHPDGIVVETLLRGGYKKLD